MTRGVAPPFTKYSGSERTAWRMNQTGVWGTGSPRAARRKALSWSGPLAGAVVLRNLRG